MSLNNDHAARQGVSMSSSKSLTTGCAAADRVYYAHKARLECIEAAIHQLGRLRHEWGFTIDALPDYLNEARTALWKAYHAEQKQKPATVPEVDQ